MTPCREGQEFRDDSTEHYYYEHDYEGLEIIQNHVTSFKEDPFSTFI